LFHRTYEKGEEIDEWRSTHCGPLEEMVEQGLCHYGKRVLVEGAGTRMIEGYAISKDEWQYRQYKAAQSAPIMRLIRIKGTYKEPSSAFKQVAKASKSPFKIAPFPKV